MVDDNKIDKCYELSKAMRLDALEMAKSAGKGGTHLGGGFSSMDIIATLYGAVLNYRCNEPDWEDRDRFITSKRHCYLASYSALHQTGMISKEQLMSFYEDGGVLAGYPWHPTLGLDFSGGSLGMGLSVGIGMALAGRRKGKTYNIYVLLGDGECNEGANWEGFMSASKFGLDNLVVIIDNNHMQFDGAEEDIMPMGSFKEKLDAFGFVSVNVNGHCIEDLYNAFQTEHEGKPLAIIADTIKGYGLPSIENKAESHHIKLKEKDYEYMLNDIREGRYDRVH
jgi:transketolase